MNLLRRPTIAAEPPSPAAEQPEPSPVERLWAEVASARPRIEELRATVERNAARLAEAEGEQAAGRRDLARQRARDEVTDQEQADGLRALAESVTVEQDAVERAQEVLDAAREGLRELGGELEAAVAAETAAQMRVLEVEEAELRERLMDLAERRERAAEANEETLDAVRQVRLEGDPGLAAFTAGLERQRRESLNSRARQGRVVGRWHELNKKDLAFVEAEGRRLATPAPFLLSLFECSENVSSALLPRRCPVTR